MVASNLDMFRYSWVWVKNRATGHMLSKVKPMKKHEDICIFSKSSMDNRGKANNVIRYYPQGLVDVSN
jgi:site-specific DNA-methyltransferase (adenine-specific)